MGLDHVPSRPMLHVPGPPMVWMSGTGFRRQLYVRLTSAPPLRAAEPPTPCSTCGSSDSDVREDAPACPAGSSLRLAWPELTAQWAQDSVVKQVAGQDE